MNRVDLKGAVKRAGTLFAEAKNHDDRATWAFLEGTSTIQADGHMKARDRKQKHGDYWLEEVRRLVAQSTIDSAVGAVFSPAKKKEIIGEHGTLDRAVAEMKGPVSTAREKIRELRHHRSNVGTKPNVWLRMKTATEMALQAPSCVVSTKTFYSGKPPMKPSSALNVVRFQILPFGSKRLLKELSMDPTYKQMTNGGMAWTKSSVNTITTSIDIPSLKEEMDHHLLKVPLDYGSIPAQTREMLTPFRGVPFLVTPQFQYDGLMVSKVFGIALCEQKRVGASIYEKAHIHTKGSPSPIPHYCEWWAASSTHLDNPIVVGAYKQADAIKRCQNLIVEYVTDRL